MSGYDLFRDDLKMAAKQMAMNDTNKRKPKTKREWALHRALLNCSVGRDELEQQNVSSGQRYEPTFYCLLNAIEEIVKAMALEEEREMMPDAPSIKEDKCRWAYIERSFDYVRYRTTCRDDFVGEFDAKYEGFDYCPYCGKPVALDDEPKTGKDM